jgi:hypothetical protein
MSFSDFVDFGVFEWRWGSGRGEDPGASQWTVRRHHDISIFAEFDQLLLVQVRVTFHLQIS